MKSMDDYVRAFSEIGPLLDNYDRHLQRITDLSNQAHERDKGLLTVNTLQETTSHELGKHVGDSGHNVR